MIHARQGSETGVKMRHIPAVVLVCAVAVCLTATAGTAQAATAWADGSTWVLGPQLTTNNTNQSRLSGSPFPAPDRSVIFQNPVGGSGAADTLTITWTFSGATYALADFFIWLVRTNYGGVTATVTNYNGVAVAGTPVLIPTHDYGGTGDAVIMPFPTGGVTPANSVVVSFNMPENSQLRIDAFGTPEPAAFILFGAGLLGLGAWVRRRRKK